jgi:hypothetical protein
MWQIFEDTGYKDYFLSVYKYVEDGHVGDDFEIRVREGNGLDDTGEWSEAIYIDHCESHSAAMAIGKAFVTGIFKERANRQSNHQSGFVTE